MNPMQRVRANLKVACTLKIEPETWFSSNLSNYVRHLASYYQVDAHAMVLSIINGVATTCRSMYVNRASHFLVPCNLYNLVVTRSGYSKSNILDMAELIAEAAATYFPQMADNKVVNEEPYDAATSSTTKRTTTNVLNQQKFCKNVTKVVFNDGTPAGILNNLKQSMRTMHLHEADVTLKSFGLLLPSPSDITPAKIDSFRSTLMTLYEKPGQFCRILKKEKIDVLGYKLNIFGASTDELIASELVRIATYSSADALFERFILWPLDGEPIPNEKFITTIDYSQYCSLEQFAVLFGFLADLILELESDGKNILADQALEFRTAGSKPNVEDNVSARLNKMALASYRIAGLCGLTEAAFDLVSAYIDHYATFGNGQADEVFLNRAEKIVDMKYGPIIRNEQNFLIDTEICYRAQNVIAQNLAHYM